MNKRKSKDELQVAVPLNDVLQPDLKTMIKEAEKGPFYSLKELEAKFDKWKSSLKK